MKQSSVDWLIDQVEDFIGLIPVDLIEKARQMHKEEIRDSIIYGIGLESGTINHDFKQGSIIDVYYNNTFEQ